MKKYDVFIEEMLVKVIENVEAENEEEAEKIIKDKYEKGEIVLTAEDFCYYQIFDVVENKEVL